MATITDIKRKIQELGAAPFQEFCDTLMKKKGYGNVHGYGMQAGTGNTTKGNPDTYFRKDNGKYVFVAYTIQKNGLYSKIKEDIDKCLDPAKTGLDTNDIDEIVYCHTSSNLSAGEDKLLHELCAKYKIELTIWGIDEIANEVHNQYRSMAKDFLGLSIDTNQILNIDEFIDMYDSNGMSAPLNTIFKYRKNEKEQLMESLDSEAVVIVTGKAGVGKTRLVLETTREYSQKNAYKLFCVKNNNLGIYDDLVAVTEQPGNYLFFIDDANELSEIDQILRYTIKSNLGYSVKIIATVRDYAKSKVISEAYEYTKPKIIELSSFSDEEIKGFLNDNLKIYNEEYINQIIRISEGNPRIAYMAGRLAVEKQNLSAITDVSQLYDVYYAKYISETIGNDSALCFTAGILSIINAVVINNLEVLQELFDKYGMDSNEFKNRIYQLARYEVVEIKVDQVAIFSDQCLANYLLFYVFFQRKLIPFSCILEIGYKHFRNGVFRAINTILKIFESEENKKYCKQEILKAWDNLKKNQEACYRDFVGDFHIFRPEESFLIAQNEIDALNEEKFNVFDVDFKRNDFYSNVGVLDLLSGYQYSEYIDVVMELLLEYASKSAENMICGLKWLKNCYGIDIDDYKYGFFTQVNIGKYLFGAIKKGNEIAKVYGLYWTKYALGFSFSPTGVGRNNTFVMYHIEMRSKKGVKEYRNECWNILTELASMNEWKTRIIMALDEYSRQLHRELDESVIKEDMISVQNLLSVLSSNNIAFLKALERLLAAWRTYNFSFDNKWEDCYATKEWELYSLLEENFVSSDLNYDEYERKRRNNIIEYGKSLKLVDIENLVKDINVILSDSIINHDSYSINQGIEILLQTFGEEYLHEFLKNYVRYGSNITIRPSIVLDVLNKKDDSKRLLEVLKNEQYPQKNDWLFSFFETLPEEKTSAEFLSEFWTFLKSDEDKSLVSAGYRRLRVLDKFIKLEPAIYPIACAIIYEKRKYSEFVADLYFELLFHDKIYSPEELLVLFKGSEDVLQDIYFFMMKQGKLGDLTGTFLIRFLQLGETWLQRYTDFFWEHALHYSDNNYYKNDVLWKSDNYMIYFDYIYNHFPDDKMYSWKISIAFKNVFLHTGNDQTILMHQKKWISHLIAENATTDQIIIIFEMLTELNDEFRREAIKVLLEYNSDFELFEKLQLTPNYWSSDDKGSFIHAYQKQIEYLKSLLPLLPGMKYIKHKAKVNSEIEMLQEMIKREEVNLICRQLYM